MNAGSKKRVSVKITFVLREAAKVLNREPDALAIDVLIAGGGITAVRRREVEALADYCKTKALEGEAAS